jgi:hypothetical protein
VEVAPQLRPEGTGLKTANEHTSVVHGGAVDVIVDDVENAEVLEVVDDEVDDEVIEDEGISALVEIEKEALVVTGQSVTVRVRLMTPRLLTVSA